MAESLVPASATAVDDADAALDPYRSGPLEARGMRTLAGPSRWTTLWHLALTGGLTGGMVALVALSALPLIVLVGAGAIATAAGFDFLRTLHEATLPHRVTADERGIEFQFSEAARLRPWMRRRSHAAPWAAIETVRLHQAGTTEATLVVQAGAESFQIPGGSVSPHGVVLQRRILDEAETRLRTAGRGQLASGESLRRWRHERFATPLRLEAEGEELARTLYILAAMLFAGGGTFASVMIGGIAWVVLALPALLTAAAFAWGGVRTNPSRLVVLDSQGISVGANPGAMRRYPWAQVQRARRLVLNGKTFGVEVSLVGGVQVPLRGRYALPLDALAELISPSTRTLAAPSERRALPEPGPMADGEARHHDGE